jgi:Family of unknown function (DUF5678)
MDRAVVEQYQDRWVAIQHDGTVVADAEDLEALLSLLQTMPDSKAAIQRIPAFNEPVFVGLR